MVKIWGRLGIQKKIFAALATVLLLMAGMLALQIISSGIQHRLSDRLITRLLARGAVRYVRRLVLAVDDEGAWYLLAARPAVRNHFLGEYESHATQVTRWLRSTQQQAPSDERMALAQANKWWQWYLAGNERAFRLLRERRSPEARMLYVAADYAPVMRALSSYESVIQAQIDLTQRQRRTVDVVSFIIAGALSAAALALAIFTAVRFGGALRSRLGAVSNALAGVVDNDFVQLDASFRNVASGDLTAPRYVYDRTALEVDSSDEVGLLAQSYNNLLASLREMSQRIDQAVLEARRRREAEERLAYLERYDEATRLPNRRLLQLELQHAVESGEPLAIAYFGLLGFKMIENSFGHAFAQEVTAFVAQRLRGSLRERDLAGRGGTDEFIVVFDGVEGRKEAVDRTRHLIAVLSKPFALEGRELLVNVSAGVSVHPDDGDEADELLRNANTAMSYAKESGRSEVVLYASSLRKHSLARVTLESDLQRALEQGEFELYYQPIVNVSAKHVDAFEALIRWRHPRLGLLEPASFIDVAEDSGSIEAIGSWVLQTACAQAQQWRSHGYDVGISVNVSMRQFRGDLFEMVERALWQTQLPANSLELELTESVLVDRRRASETLAELKRLGARVAIDDFGTGYSSLAYLQTFPLDGLKIDRSFVSDITKRSYDRAIANTIILLGHSLGVRIVAEGVVDAGQAAMLRKLGCDAMQGYFFGRPAPAGETFELLKTFEAGAG